MSEVSISEIPARTPVITEEQNKRLPTNETDRQWGFITEAARREIIENPTARKVVMNFCDRPLHELLPDQFVNAISSINERIGRLVDRYRAGISEYLALPAVPDNQLKPDIRHALGLDTPEKAIKRLRRIFKDDDPQFQEMLESYISSGTFLQGIAFEERSLVAQRYRYARDVKLLALGAEIQDRGVKLSQEGEATLQSGIRIKLDNPDDEQRQDLLSPHLWKKRTQLKDRVYEISVNGRKYILKEKKTARHTDTKKDGHREGRSSSEEFEIAKYFLESGNVTRKDVRVSWERPVGFVTYPDGFSFVVFEYEEGLIKSSDLVSKLADEVIQRRSEFDKEYQDLVKAAQRHKTNPEVQFYERELDEVGLKAAAQRMGITRPKPLELTYEQFAIVKALRMERRANELLKETIVRNGYQNSDMDGYLYRINTTPSLELEIVGFDFEYFSEIPGEELEEKIGRSGQFDREWESKHGIGFINWDNGTRVTRGQVAAYFAMLEQEGILTSKFEIF